jgi:hypothetical protein
MTPRPAASDPASAILRWIGMGITLAGEDVDTQEIERALMPEITFDLSRFPDPDQAITDGTRAIAEALL